MGRIAQRPSTNAAQNKKGGWSNPRVTRLRQGTGSEFSGSLPMLSCYVLLPPACGFGGDIGVNVGAISPSAIAAGMPIALACSSTFCRTTPPCWRAVSANGEPPAGNVGGREANGSVMFAIVVSPCWLGGCGFRQQKASADICPAEAQKNFCFGGLKADLLTSQSAAMGGTEKKLPAGGTGWFAKD